MTNTFEDRLKIIPKPVRLAAFAILLAVLAFAAYSNSFHTSFQLDDMHQVVQNPNITSLSNIPRYFTDKGTSSALPDVDFFRPLTTSSFAISYALGGLDVEGYHVFNLVLHILNCMLVLLVVGAVLRKTGRDDTLLPYLAALLFCLHPIQTSAVTYISARAVLLSSLFSLSAFYVFMRYRDADGPARLAWGAAGPALFLAGLLSKEMTVGILGAMLAYDLVLCRERRNGRPRYWSYYLLFGLAGGLFFWMRSSLGVTVADLGRDYTPLNYLMSETKVVVLYIRLLLLPVNQNADYVLPLTTSLDTGVALCALFIGLAVYGLLRIRKTAAAESFMGLFFFAALLPESSVFPIYDIAVEYRLYLPSVGFITLAVLLADRFLRPKSVMVAVVMAVALFFGVLTFSRNRVYSTEYTYWSDVAAKSPHSIRAQLHHGIELANDNKYGEALRTLEEGLLMYQVKESDSLIQDSLVCNAYDRLGEALYEQGSFDKAAEVFARQADMFPNLPQPHYNLALSLMMLDRNDEALKQLEKASELKGTDFDIRYNLALAYEKTGRLDEASLNAAYAFALASGEAEKANVQRLLKRLKTNEGQNGNRAAGSGNR